jgi:hypothetical protein
MSPHFNNVDTRRTVVYTGWAALKPKVIKICVAYQAAVILIGSTTLSRNFVIIIVPLAAFSIAVLAYAINHYARDADWQVIHDIFGANLRDIANIMRSDDQVSRCYGLDQQDRRRLGLLASRPEALTAVQELFANHPIIDEEPKAINKRIADVMLLLLGAIVGAFAQHWLAPPNSYEPIWKLNLGAFARQEWHMLVIMSFLILSFICLSIVANRRNARETRFLRQYAVARPLSLLTDTLVAAPEVRRKVGDAARWASNMATVDIASIQALEGVTGTKIIKVGQLGTALGDVQWTMLMFNMGILLGAILPRMLGIPA